MSESESGAKEPEEREDATTTAYTTTAVGVALLVAAVLVIITAGTPAAGVGFVIGAAACLGWSVPQLVRRRELPALASQESELLSAIRDNGGAITPTEAAMDTSLTVREADAMLSELANSGHLRVQSREGTLVYALPSSRAAQLEG